MKLTFFAYLLVFIIVVQGRWSEEKAKEWYGKYSWGAGVNYTPAYADN